MIRFRPGMTAAPVGSVNRPRMNLWVPKMLCVFGRAGCAALAVVTLWGVSAPPALGQTARFEPGTRLRVTIPCSVQVPAQPSTTEPTCPVEGRLLRLGSDSLTMASAQATHTYAFSDLVRAEIGNGLRSRRSLGAGVGGVFGAVATYVALNSGGSTAFCDQSANQDSIDTGWCLGLYVLGGLAGAGLGSLVGGLMTSERWEVVPLESLGVSLGLGLGRTSDLAVRVTF